MIGEDLELDMHIEFYVQKIAHYTVFLSRKDAERCDTSPIPTSTALRPNTSLCSMCIQGFIRLITNKRWAWAISTCIDSLMGSNMEMGTLSHSQC